MRWIWLLAVGAACGDNLAGPQPDASPAGGGVRVTANTAATLDAGDVRGMAIAALDDHGVAVARVDDSGTAICPDCVGLDPSQCPDVCERATVTVRGYDTAGAPGASITIATVFPPSSDHGVDEVDVVALGPDRAGVAWLECDDSTCNALFSKESCTARYTTVDLATGAVAPAHTLYASWFGDLRLTFDASTKRLLAVVGKQEAFGLGVRRAIFDETGATALADWAPLGSTGARSPAAIASAGGFVIVADDLDPTAPPLATPCASSCDCLAGPGSADLDAGGLYAFTVGDGADAAERVALGRGADGSYGTRERAALIDAGGSLAIMDTQSIDRSAEIFTRDADGWHARLTSAAPLPVWIGALGTSEALAWLGSDVEAGQPATVQRLVAGIATAAGTTRTAFSDPLDRNVFEAAPVATPTGVSTTFLLQGIFGHVNGQPVWDHFEVLRVSLGRE